MQALAPPFSKLERRHRKLSRKATGHSGNTLFIVLAMFDRRERNLLERDLDAEKAVPASYARSSKPWRITDRLVTLSERIA
jgi:hypothetical protein